MNRDASYFSRTTLADGLAGKLSDAWRGEKPPTALRPLGALYGLGAALRRKLYGPVFKVRRAERPVVSIGNLTVGGSGKTPACLALARLLLDRGYRPAVLSRGYGRRTEAGTPPPIIVSRGRGPETPPELSGDEPWLMAEELPGLRVVVDADRARGARAAVEELGADMLILDDGHQHLKLAADCRVLLIPADQPFGNRAVLPAGPMREFISAHKTADILVNTGTVTPTAEALELSGGRPLFTADYRPLGWRTLGLDALEPLESMAGRPVFAFCGLGRPQSFLRTLNDLGLNMRRFTALGDHQVYDRDALNALGLDFLASGAEVMVTTAKDAVKLPRGFPLPVKVLKIDLDISESGEFVDAVLGTIARNGAGR